MRNVAIDEYKRRSFTKANGLEYNSTTDMVFDYTNEIMRLYINLLNVENGRVATVGSSGDQAFYSIFNGADEVTVVDGNPYARPMIELKRSAIKNMTRREFLKYWTFDEVLRPDNLKHLIGDVGKQSCDFFNTLIRDMQSGQNRDKIYEKITDSVVGYGFLRSSAYDESALIQYVGNCEFYTSDRAFNQLKERIMHSKIKYKTVELSNFPRVLNGKYNTIMLSNVRDYVDDNVYFDTAKTLIDKNLANNGTMQMYYDFNFGASKTFNTSMSECLPDKIPCDLYYINSHDDSIRPVVKEPNSVDVGDRLLYVYEKE